MRPLDRKLLRDLHAMRGQMLAVVVVMTCGLMVMVMERGLVVSLETSKAAYYHDHRLADIFSDLKRAPKSVRGRLAELSGVAALETRVKGAAMLDLPGMVESAEAAMVSLPDEHPQRLNRLHLTQGRLPIPGRRGEAVVSDGFAQAHGFRPGDAIDATIHGARERLRIVGVAMSPEFVYELPPGAIVPDNRRFGVFWMSEGELAEALGMDGAFNNVVAALAPGGDPRAVKAGLDRILAPYGGLAAYGRDEHPSAKMVEDEIQGLRGVAVAFPLVFLSIAAFMTSAALTRLVRLQREQIAQLKAFGYGRRAIGGHYFKFALAAVAVAAVSGSALGMWAGSALLPMYHQFFRFPALSFHPDWNALWVGLLASAAASGLGVAGAVRQAMNLPPAEAMRPEPPAEYKPAILERLGLQRLAPPPMRMALRNLERKPWQALFTALGLAMAAAIPIVAVAMADGMNHMMEFQWGRIQRHDATISLIEPTSFSALAEVRAMPGVLAAEPFRAVQARLHHGHRRRRVAVTGLEEGARLQRLLDEDGRAADMPLAGLLLSAQLAEILGAAPGDPIRIEVQEGRRPVVDTVVGGTITDYAGVGAYMEIGALRRLMGEGATLSGAHLAVDQAHWAAFQSAAKEAPRIGAVSATSAARESYDRLAGDMMGISQAIFFFFAVVVAFGVIYNGARIALSERTRDLATLRVVGFTQGEVAGVLIGELALLTLIALPPGLYLGRWLTHAILEAVSTETLRVPVVVTSRAYATAALIVLLSSAVSFAAVARRIHHLDLLAVLKARE